MGRFSEAASYVWGTPLSSSEGVLVLSFDEMARRLLPHSVFIKWQAGVFSDGGRTAWLTAGIATIAEAGDLVTVVVSNFGKTLEISQSGRLPGDIGGVDGVEKRGPLRRVRTIGKHVYVVGGNRQVYRRTAPGLWIPMDQGTRPDANESRIVGFESVDGLSEQEIYAVGWDGEIWVFNGQGWSQNVSPTNLLLTEICSAGDGKVYIGGREGLLFCGRNETWEVVDASEMVDDIWSMAWFKETLYISGMRGLYTIVDNTVVPVDIDVDGVSSFFWLAKTDDVLWSVGARDVISFDGKVWSRVD